MLTHQNLQRSQGLTVLSFLASLNENILPSNIFQFPNNISNKLLLFFIENFKYITSNSLQQCDQHVIEFFHRLSWTNQCGMAVHKATKQFNLLRRTCYFINDSK